MARTEAQKRARRKYERNQRRLVITLYPSDAEIEARIEKIESLGLGYAEYIRELIRHDIKNRPL